MVFFVKKELFKQGSCLFFWSLFIICSMAGSKLFVLFEPYIEFPSVLFNLNQGFVYYGALMGAYFSIYMYSSIEKISFGVIADNVSKIIPFAFAVGKVGCTFTGCCYGIYHDSFLSVTYYKKNTPAPQNIPLFPSQILDLAISLVIGIYLVFFDKTKRKEGNTTLLYLFLYSVSRFIMEFYRGDKSRGFTIGGILSNSQLFALLTLIFVLCFVLMRSIKKDKMDAIS